MPTDEEEKYHWLVVFRERQAPYTYKFRTESYMAEVVAKHREQYGVFPYRMWIIVDNEIKKVVIK